MNYQKMGKYYVYAKHKPCCSICAKDVAHPDNAQILLNQGAAEGLKFCWMYVYTPSGCGGGGSFCPSQALVMVFEKKG